MITWIAAGAISRLEWDLAEFDMRFPHQQSSQRPTARRLLFHLLTNPTDKRESEREMLELLGQDVDLIVLARYMQILGPEFVAQYLLRMINIHHSFLPAFIGAKPYHQAFERGVKLIGATSHYVTATLDEGPIIEQDVVRVSHRDTVEEMLQKGRDLERVVVYQNKTVVFA
jgi:formyltetrahydrofolate deformylase